MNANDIRHRTVKDVVRWLTLHNGCRTHWDHEAIRFDSGHTWLTKPLRSKVWCTMRKGVQLQGPSKPAQRKETWIDVYWRKWDALHGIE